MQTKRLMYKKNNRVNFLFMAKLKQIEIIEEILEHQGISIPEFQKMMGIQSQHWNNWKNRGVPGNRLISVAGTLHTTVEELAPGLKKNEAKHQKATVHVSQALQQTNKKLAEVVGETPSFDQKRFTIQNTDEISENKQAFSNRLNAILDLDHIPEKGKGRQGSLAKIFDVSDKGARKWIEGESIPSLERLIDIVKEFKDTGVTIEWLLTGNPLFHPDIIKSEDSPIRPTQHNLKYQMTQKLPGHRSIRSPQVASTNPLSAFNELSNTLSTAYRDEKLNDTDCTLINEIIKRFIK